MCCLLFLTDMARGRGRGRTLPGRTSSGRGSKASGMPDPGRGSGVDETPQQTEEVVNVPQQQHRQTGPHHGPEIVMNDQETWEGEEGEDGDVGESSSEPPTDETLPIAQFDLTIDNPYDMKLN